MTISRKKIGLYAAILIVLIIGFVFIFTQFSSKNQPAGNDVVSNDSTGMYQNPIIYADVPDPDVIRVEDVYYMVSTSMHMMPGTPIMKSTDLINWEIIGYPYDRLEDNDAHNLRDGQNVYGQGAWASSLKYYNGVFYVLTAALDSGKTYLFSTTDPAGEWERTEFNEYLHDPALFFEDDGKAYIIYGIENFSIKQLTADYKAIDPAGLSGEIMQSGQPGMEGAHVYKIDGKYYITAIWWEQGEIRRQYIYRSDTINGPYEGRLVLSDTMGYKNSGIAQGGLVDTPSGDWYAMLFQDHDAVGRIPILVPVSWKDGWPVYGKEEKAPTSIAAVGTSQIRTELTRSDEFLQEDTIDVVTNESANTTESISKASGTELALNGSFHSGIADWSGKDQAKIAVIEDSGNKIAHVFGRNVTYAGIEQNYTKKLVSGERYHVSFKVKYTEGPDTKDFILTARKLNNGNTSYENLISATVTKNEWTEISGTFTIQDEFNFIYLFVETPWTDKPDQKTDLMDFYVDDFSVKGKPLSATELAERKPNGSKLGLQWQWNHNPDHTRWSLTDRKGYLRLATGALTDNIHQARNTLTQRAIGPQSSGWISLDTSHMMDGDYAGIAAFQQEYGFVGVTQQAGEQFIVMVEDGNEIAREPLEHPSLYAKIDFDFTSDQATFFYSLNGTDWITIGKKLEMKYTIPHFTGYRFALFNYATEQPGGYVDIDFFRFSESLTGEVTPFEPAAYLQQYQIQLSKEANSEYEISLMLDEAASSENFNQIEAEIVLPSIFELAKVTSHPTNVSSSAKLTTEKTSNGFKLLIDRTNNDRPLYRNDDGSKRIATMSIKLKEELNEKLEEEIKVQSLTLLEGDGKTMDVNVSGAVSKVTYSPPNEAIGKKLEYGNPLVSYKFGADPYALVYQDRVYLYMTNDVLEYDDNGEVKDNTYGTINKITVISSDDLVNWTDHGEIYAAGKDGAATWATQSWAPAAVHKVIDGKDKFFLYFANNASNIGVLTSDSPVGPWVDPIGKPLISRTDAGVEGVTWLFDPAVLVDDDGQGYIYFGGGIPEGQHVMPNTARVMKLGEDMISLEGTAEVIPAPYMFENSGINKVDGVYYYTYCSNFIDGDRSADSPPPGQIAYMTSDSPMGPWTYQGTILKNPGHFFDVGGNNHHAIFEFNDQHYIAYHAQTLSKAMGVPKGYRSTHLNKVFFEGNGSIKEIEADYQGVPQVKNVNPFVRVEAETVGWNAGIKMEKYATTERVVADIHNGDWIGLSNVDFGAQGATEFIANIAASNQPASIELRLGSPVGVKIGELKVAASASSDEYVDLQTEISTVTGKHHLFLVFKGESDQELFKFNNWQFK